MTIEYSLQSVDVLALELQSPLLLESTSSVNAAIVAMQQHCLGYALITEQEKLVGIFTERDIFLSVIDNEHLLSQPVSSLMTCNPLSVHETDSIWHVIELMHKGDYRQIPVIDTEHRVIACVRHKDVAEYLVQHFSSYVLNLPPNPEQLAKTPEGG